MMIVVDKEQDKSVNLKKVDQKLVLKHAKKFKVANGGSLADTVKALYARLNDTDGEVGDCTTCGGAWPAEFEACPFCGDTDREEEPSSGAASTPTSAASESSGAESSEVMGGTESEEPPDSVAIVPAEREVPTTLAGGSKVATEQREEDLDKAVAYINQAKEHGAKSFAVMIMTLKRIVDSNLWKTRTDDKGELAYKSWSDFAAKELEFSRPYAERLLKVANEFGRDLVEQLGANKLIVVLSVPKDKRQEVLDKARAGASRRKLQAISVELNTAAGKNPGNRKKPVEVKVDPNEITLGVILNKRQTIPLFTPKKDEKSGAFKPAKKLDEQPHGWLNLSNGVRLVFQLLRMPSGQLKLTMNAKREG